MSYFLYLRAVIHQGTDRKLMKKKGQRVLDMVLLCACLVSGYVCVCVCVCMCLCVEGGCYASVCECVHAKASYRVFFSVLR